MTIISFTKPISEFASYFQNSYEVSKVINLGNCTEFWDKGSNAEVLIYSERKILYSCCYTEWGSKKYITSVWSNNGIEYEYTLKDEDFGSY